MRGRGNAMKAGVMEWRQGWDEGMKARLPSSLEPKLETEDEKLEPRTET